MAVSYDTNEWCTYEKITRLLKNLGAQNSHHTLKRNIRILSNSLINTSQRVRTIRQTYA